MNDKVNKLKAGETIKFYDKNSIEALSDKVGRILTVKQCESHFEIRVATEQEIKQGFSNLCKNLEESLTNGNLLQKYIKEAKVLWQE